jgi:Carboxypeptidase regulatory-like domain
MRQSALVVLLALNRYAARCANFVLVVTFIAVLAARSAAEDTGNQRGSEGMSSGGAPWLVSTAVLAQAPGQGGPNIPRPPAGGVTGPRAPGMPPRDQITQPTGTAVVRGRVTRADTGQPLRRVQVRAIAPELREGRMAMTDEDGRYELKDLPAGRISVMASKGGFVSLQFGQRRPLQAGQPIEIADGQVVEKIDFALPRGGVISGQVLDEFGDPVTGALVQVLRYQFINGQRRLMPVAGGNQTDDRGDFRVFGVAPGDYYVNATLRNGGPFASASDDRIGYAPTYYPGTPVSAEAQRINVGLGQEVPGIVIQLVPARTTTISGLARGGDGRPLANAPIMVIQRSDDGAPNFGFVNGTQTRADGTFTVGNVSPGNYTLQARSLANPTESATVDVVAGGADITGLVLTVTRGATARGRIRFERGATAADLRPGDVRIFPAPADGAPLIGGGPGVVNDDWTFEVSGLSGRRFLRFNVPPTWAVKSIGVDGTDVIDTPIEFKGDDVDGIDVTLTQRITEVSGSVNGDGGAKVTDATIVLFADDREKWTPQTRFIRSVRPDQQAQFKIRGLPPGRYIAVALDYIEPGEETNPETLEQLRSRGTSLTLREGEMRAIELKVTPGL